MRRARLLFERFGWEVFVLMSGFLLHFFFKFYFNFVETSDTRMKAGEPFVYDFVIRKIAYLSFSKNLTEVRTLNLVLICKIRNLYQFIVISLKHLLHLDRSQSRSFADNRNGDLLGF